MAFKWVNTPLYAVPSRITHIPGTLNETFTKGEALKLTAGKWTKAATTDIVGGFANENKTCVAGNDSLEVIEARPGDRFRVPYTGTPAAGFLVGANAVAIAADGLSVDSATVAGGALAVWEVNTNKKEAIVSVVKRIFS